MGRGFVVYLRVQRTMQDRKQKDKPAATERGACWCIVFLLRGGGGENGGGCGMRFVASRVARGGEGGSGGGSGGGGGGGGDERLLKDYVCLGVTGRAS